MLFTKIICLVPFPSLTYIHLNDVKTLFVYVLFSSSSLFPMLRRISSSVKKHELLDMSNKKDSIP